MRIPRIRFSGASLLVHHCAFSFEGVFSMPAVNSHGLVHFSLPANDVEESLRFYTDILGFQFRGKVGARGRCVTTSDGVVNIVLAERPTPLPPEEGLTRDGALCHHAFYVSSDEFDLAVDAIRESGVKVDDEIEWRNSGTFNGRSFYFYDPSGNRLEINDPTPPVWPDNLPNREDRVRS
jgi:catechol 2,3-dioxygenase-like lactoylglutathione lyase family enzyme